MDITQCIEQDANNANIDNNAQNTMHITHAWDIMHIKQYIKNNAYTKLI